MRDKYLTVTGVSEGYYTEKRSKFYAFLHHVESADEVQALHREYKKKYYDARHVCYAYRLGAEGEAFRANDDGEPSSTAGKPILGALLSADITDAVIFVIRYYGGVNLGTGGLIVAYREAATLAVDDARSHSSLEERLLLSADECCDEDSKGYGASHRGTGFPDHLFHHALHSPFADAPAEGTA